MMYKLVNGKLVTPPTVWKGRVGYCNDINALLADGWKPLQETGEGSAFRYIERPDFIEKVYYKEEKDYRARRAEAYPELGDVIDALLKAYQGDAAELEAIIAKREAVKRSIGKEND